MEKIRPQQHDLACDALVEAIVTCGDEMSRTFCGVDRWYGRAYILVMELQSVGAELEFVGHGETLKECLAAWLKLCRDRLLDQGWLLTWEDRGRDPTFKLRRADGHQAESA